MTIGGYRIGCAREAARVEVLPRFGEDSRDGAVSDVAYVDELVVCGERAWVAADGDVLYKGVLSRVDHGHGVRLYHDCFRAAGISEREHGRERGAHENGRAHEQRPAPGEPGRDQGSRGRGCAECWILAQDRLLELAERGTRLDAQAVEEGAAYIAVGLERLRLSAAAIQRRH